MQRVILLISFCVLTSHLVTGQPFQQKDRGKQIGIRCYKNIEFFGMAFFIGSMGAQYENDTTWMIKGVKKQDWFAWDLALYKKYRSFATHPDLQTMARFGEQQDGSPLVRLLIQLDEFPRAVINPEKDASWLRPFVRQGDSAASIREIIAFVEASNRLYKAMDFDRYFQENARVYEKAWAEIRSVLPATSLIITMEQFYRQSFAHYALLPSLTIPSGWGFGVNYTAAGKTTIMNLFGPFAVQQFRDTSHLNMGFADSSHIRELSTHEFGHSFSNPAVSLVPPSIVKETALLYGPVKEAMENQGYNTWYSCLGEYFVRAGEVVIARKLGNLVSAERLQKEYMNTRKFIYLPLVIGELEKYDRDKGMTYQQAVNNVMERLRVIAHPSGLH